MVLAGGELGFAQAVTSNPSGSAPWPVAVLVTLLVLVADGVRRRLGRIRTSSYILVAEDGVMAMADALDRDGSRGHIRRCDDMGATEHPCLAWIEHVVAIGVTAHLGRRVVATLG